ncbi:MAG: hypothetical protein Fur0023_19040 [Bacteroidia bacterium]
MNDKKILLNAEQVELKIQRLSYEIAERYHNTKTLYVFGIEGQGYKLAERIIKEIADSSWKCNKLFLREWFKFSE